MLVLSARDHRDYKFICGEDVEHDTKDLGLNRMIYCEK